jgi:hypothetical protein
VRDLRRLNSLRVGVYVHVCAWLSLLHARSCISPPTVEKPWCMWPVAASSYLSRRVSMTLDGPVTSVVPQAGFRRTGYLVTPPHACTHPSRSGFHAKAKRNDLCDLLSLWTSLARSGPWPSVLSLWPFALGANQTRRSTHTYAPLQYRSYRSSTQNYAFSLLCLNKARLLYITFVHASNTLIAVPQHNAHPHSAHDSPGRTRTSIA